MSHRFEFQGAQHAPVRDIVKGPPQRWCKMRVAPRPQVLTSHRGSKRELFFDALRREQPHACGLRLLKVHQQHQSHVAVSWQPAIKRQA